MARRKLHADFPVGLVVVTIFGVIAVAFVGLFKLALAIVLLAVAYFAFRRRRRFRRRRT